jgi:catechol 2,3-dioxygenase-like lactoylglutathione lyase family enzyme
MLGPVTDDPRRAVPAYRFDHIHLNSADPRAAAEYYRRIFGARIVESVQLDGQPRFDVDLDGLMIFLAQVAPGAEVAGPAADAPGLAHFGLRVEDLDQAVADLRRAGAKFAVEPYTSKRRAGLRVAFIEAPENVLIELLERRDPGRAG